MKKIIIELTDEQFERYQELKNTIEQEYENEKFQAKPYLVTIEHEVFEPRPEEQSEESIYYDCDYTQYTYEELKETEQENYNSYLADEGHLEFDEWLTHFEYGGYEQIRGNIEKQYLVGNGDFYVGLTRKGAENYINSYKGKSLQNPHSYAFGSASSEINLLIKMLLNSKEEE